MSFVHAMDTKVMWFCLFSMTVYACPSPSPAFPASECVFLTLLHAPSYGLGLPMSPGSWAAKGHKRLLPGFVPHHLDSWNMEKGGGW